MKLHPNIKHCVRLDVARVLVEVDIGKALPSKICLKNKYGKYVTVGVNFPWLPPCCNFCSKSGHTENDCQELHAVEIKKKKHWERSRRFLILEVPRT